MCTLKIAIMDTKQAFKMPRNLIPLLVFQMFRWMLPQRDLWIAHEHGGAQMDALQRGLVDPHEHTTWFKWMLYRGMHAPWDHHSGGYWGREISWGTWMMWYVCYGCPSRWTCCCTQTKLELHYVHYGCLNKQACCCTWTLLIINVVSVINFFCSLLCYNG